MARDRMHMAWCEGLHDDTYNNGDCMILRAIGSGDDDPTATVTLTGIVCDTTTLNFDGFLWDAGQLDRYLECIAELRPLFEAGRAEIGGCNNGGHIHDNEGGWHRPDCEIFTTCPACLGDCETAPGVVCEYCRGTGTVSDCAGAECLPE